MALLECECSAMDRGVLRKVNTYLDIIWLKYWFGLVFITLKYHLLFSHICKFRASGCAFFHQSAASPLPLLPLTHKKTQFYCSLIKFAHKAPHTIYLYVCLIFHTQYTRQRCIFSSYKYTLARSSIASTSTLAIHSAHITYLYLNVLFL